jgi:hypothetical protein
VNVGENTTLGNGDVTQELVQLLIVANGELKVTRNDTGLLVVTSGVTSKLKNFSSEVLENGSEVHGGTGTDTLSVVALAEQTVNTTNGEGQTSLRRTAGIDISMSRRRKSAIVNNLRLRVLAAASLAARLSSSHFDGFDLKGLKREESLLSCEKMNVNYGKSQEIGEGACGSEGTFI